MPPSYQIKVYVTAGTYGRPRAATAACPLCTHRRAILPHASKTARAFAPASTKPNKACERGGHRAKGLSHQNGERNAPSPKSTLTANLIRRANHARTVSNRESSRLAIFNESGGHHGHLPGSMWASSASPFTSITTKATGGRREGFLPGEKRVGHQGKRCSTQCKLESRLTI